MLSATKCTLHTCSWRIKEWQAFISLTRRAPVYKIPPRRFSTSHIITESTLSLSQYFEYPESRPPPRSRALLALGWLRTQVSGSRKAKSGERCGALRAVSLVCARETGATRECIACQSAPGGSNFAPQAKTPVPKCKPRGCWCSASSFCS